MTRTLHALGLALALASTACAAPQYYAPHPCHGPDLTGCVIGDVSIVGAQKVPAKDIQEKIATAETSHPLVGVLEHIPILSLWDRIQVEYEKLDPFVLERDLARIERLYRARGYYEAHARAARVRQTGKERVRVEIVVEEGEPVTVSAVRVEWADGKPSRSVHDLVLRRATRGVPHGQPFEEAALEDTKKRLARTLTDNGYAYGTVEAKASVDLVEHHATVVFTADAGPPTKFGPIRIEGAPDLPQDRLRQAIAIREGERYSTAKLEAAQMALTDLRVLGSVDVAPELSKDRSVTEVPVVFRLTPTTLKTVKAGFGAEVGSRVSTHGLAGWENKNFLGGLRSFTVEAKPGVVFYPFTLTSLFSKPTAPFAIVPEMRLHTTLTQPGFIEARTRGTVTADLNMFQLQTTDTLGYLEFASRTGVERDLWGNRIHLGLYANAQVDQPLRLQLPGMQILSSAAGYHFLAVPFAQSTFALDLRQGPNGKADPVNPNRGFYAFSDLQFAAAGSQDVRYRADLRGYIPLSKKVTLAVRVSGGILHAFGGGLSETPNPKTPYQAMPQTVAVTSKSPNPPCVSQLTGEDDTRNRWIQIMQLRGFNSGGPNSNRGYAYGTVSPQEIVPGISPLAATAGGTPNNPLKICTPLPVATGGMAMWEASVELRFPIYEKFGMVLFVDGSDVRQSVADIVAPFAPHLTTGIGMHYATPVGPVRIDVGFRIPGAQVLGSSCPVYDPANAPIANGTNTCDPAAGRHVQGGYLDPKYGQAGSWGPVPLAVSLAIGEAF